MDRTSEIYETIDRLYRAMKEVTVSTKEEPWYILPFQARIGTMFGEPNNIIEIDQWCTATYGARYHGYTNHTGRWTRTYNGVFNFKNEADCMMFVLKWSK